MRPAGARSHSGLVPDLILEQSKKNTLDDATSICVPPIARNWVGIKTACTRTHTHAIACTLLGLNFVNISPIWTHKTCKYIFLRMRNLNMMIRESRNEVFNAKSATKDQPHIGYVDEEFTST